MSSNRLNALAHPRRHDICGHCSRPSKNRHGNASFALIIFISLAYMFQWGCELVPTRPEALFIVYRERMKSGNVTEGRKFLSEESRALALALATQYKLELPAEDFALLNILDPQSSPVATISEERLAVLQVRTLKGGVRMVRLTRENTNSPWKINIVDELKAFEAFLEAQSALEMMREKAGEYAASWKAFSDQLDRMTVTEDPAGRAQPSRQTKKPKSRKLDKDKKSDTP